MPKTLPFLTNEQRYNKSRTRAAQRQGHGGDVKRRVNITVTGEYWDKLDELGFTNKSSLIEDYIKELIAQASKE